MNFPMDSLVNTKEKLEKIIEENKAKLSVLLSNDKIIYMNFMRPFMDLGVEVNNFFTPVSHLNSVKNSEESQNAFSSCLEMLSVYSTELAHNKAVYDACKAIKESEYASLDFAQQKVLDDAIFNFELEGVALPDDKKERIKEINIRLSELSDNFSQNLLRATNAYKILINDEQILGDMPDSDREAAKIDEGWQFTLQMPSYIAFMTYVTDRAKREEVYKAYCTRAPENGAIIEDTLRLRHEKANILGFANYAELNLKTMSAPSVAGVIEFLEQLGQAGKPFAVQDMEMLKEFAAKDGVSDIASYDLAYYTEKLRKARYDFDEDMVRPYFEQGQVLAGMFDLLQTLYGIELQGIAEKLWNDKARYYKVYKAGKHIGGLSIDLEARAEKRGGAWMNEWDSHHIDGVGKLHLPEAFVVCNFPVSSAGQPSLLRHDDVSTLFHEMGHALHHLLSSVNENDVSGVNGIDWDTVEFPSQFFENYAYAAEVLDKIGRHYETGEVLPSELRDKIVAAKNFQAGMALVRQLEFGLFDMLIHKDVYNEQEVQAILDNVRNRLAVNIPPRYNKFQNGFSHIFSGGYAAGYYSYKWAEMYSSDAYCEFMDKGIFDTKLAHGYRDTVLSLGASKKMGDIYKEFIGREPDSSSILKVSGLI